MSIIGDAYDNSEEVADLRGQLVQAERLLKAALYWGTYTNLAVPANIRLFLARATATARQEKADE